jgi:acylphosphatase
MRARKHLFVSGRVQGVFYRDTCRQVADKEGVAGWASNLRDGRVEIVLEGDEDAIERVVAWCRVGTEYATVESVDVSDERPEGLSGFAIR